MKTRFVSLVVMVGITASVGAVFYTNSASALYNRAQLEDRLEQGFSTALNWDISNSSGDACRQVTRMAVNNNASVQTLRNNYINTTYAGNQPASYKSSSWLSAAGRPNTTDPVTLNFGDQNLRLQINDVQFLCGTLVVPDVGTSCSSTRTSTIYDDNRWVSSGTPDRRPNPVGNVCLRPALTGLYTQVVRVDVDSTGAFAGTTDFVRGSRLETNRNNDSRYWFSSPIDFNYRFNRPVTSNGRIELTLYTKKISGYGGVYRCNLTGGGSANVRSRSDFQSRCRTYRSQVSLDIELSSNFRLYPSVDINTGSGVIDGQRYGVSGGVRNSGRTASSDTKWQITRMIYAPGDSPPAAASVSNNSAPCDYATGYRTGSCSIFRDGERNFRVGSTSPIGSGQEVVSEPTGTSICYMTSVSTPTPASRPTWRHSDIKCVVVGKKPLVGIIGGDVRAGAGGSSGAIIGSISTIDTSRYGSWAEYGMFAPGSIANFESGGVLSSSILRSSGPLQSQLTFADQPTLGNFRSQMTSRSMPVTSTIQESSSRISGTSTPATSYTIPRTGNHRTTFTGSSLTIRGNSDISGVVMIDAPDADVIINSNVEYRNGPFSSIEQIPLVLINAKSIRLASGVTRLDAGLQTSGSISTCGNPATISDYYEGLRLSNCRNSLSLNGFVSAGSLYLRRTAGADGNSDASRAAAAERLNLRADTILRINSLTKTSNDSIRTTSITELPPRL